MKGAYRDSTGALCRAGYRVWTKREDARMRRDFPRMQTAVLAAALGRTEPSVTNRAKKLGLKKTADYLASPAACRLRRGDNVGAACRYQKGHVPANKGLRRPGWAAGRMKETQFRKGERTGMAAKNWRPIGTIAVDPEGYRRIKVRDAQPGEAHGFGNARVWPLLSRHLWAEAHGPIPAGHAVVFKDGNRGNCVLDNLELVSQADLMRRNSVHHLPAAVVHAIQLIGALKRQIRRRDHAHPSDDRRPPR